MPGPEPSATRAAEAERLAAVVREGGAIALKFFRGELRIWTKGEAKSPVSEADIAVNDLLRARLPLPGDGWLSEESENDAARLGAHRTWVVDPIDGTRAYIAGREDWSISVALVEHGRPVVACVFAPATDEMFLATAGSGATRNGVSIRVTDGAGLVGARLAGPKRLLDHLAARQPGVVAVPRIHSLALRLVRVATGELDGAIAGGNGQDWDLAAADLMVHEAGGVMTDFSGQPLIYNRAEPVHAELIACGPSRLPILLDQVRRAKAELVG